MKQQIQQRAKSKTYWLGFAVMMLSYVQSNIAQVDQFLGEYKGLVMFVIGALIMILREVTKGPLSDKNVPDSKA